MGASIGVTVGVNGESEYVRSLKNITSETRAFQSELREVQSAFDANNDLGGQWAKASDVLSKEIDAQKDKISKLKTELDAAKEKYGENSTEVYNLESKLNNAGTALHAMERQLANGNIPMLERAASETKLWQSELDRMKSTFTDKTSTWTKSWNTASVLNDGIDAQKRQIELLEEQVRNVGAAYGENSRECNEWKIKLNEANVELNRMQKELDELPNRIESIGTDMEKSGKKIQDAGKKVSKVGDTLMPISTAAIGGIYKSFDAIKDYTQNVDAAWAVTGALDRSLSETEKSQAYQTLNEQVKKYARDTVFTAEEVASALEYEGLAGWDVYQSLGALPANLDLAAASELDLARSTDILTDTASAFNIAAEDSAHIANIYAAAQANSNTTTDLLGETMGYVAGTAGGLGLSLEDIAIASGLMGNRFVKGSRAGTALNRMISNLTKPANDTAAALMDELNVSLYDSEGKTRSLHDVMDDLRSTFGMVDIDVEALADVIENDGEEAFDSYRDSLELTMTDQEKLTDLIQIFGVRALPGVLAIINATEEEYDNLTEAIYGADDAFEVNGKTVEGAAAAMAAIKNENLAGNVKLFESALYNLWVTLGEKMLPTFTKVVEGATGLINKFSELDDGTQEFIIKAGVLVAAVGPVLSVGGRLISGVGTLVSGVGGLLKFVGGLARTGASVAGGIGTVVSAIGGGASGLIGGIGSVVGAIGSVVTAAAPFLIGGLVIAGIVAGVAFVAYEIYKHWDGIKEATGKLKDWVSDKWDGINESCSKAWDGIKEATSHGWEAAKKTWNDSMSEIHTAYEKHGGGVVGLAAAAMEGIHQAHEAGFNLLNNLTGGKLDGIKQLWDGTFHNIVDGAFQFGRDAVDFLGKGFDSAWSWVSRTVSGIGDSIAGTFSGLASKAWEWGTDMMRNFSDSVKSGIGWVKDGASSIAGKIAEFLHFSEPDVGPLSDFHTFMPDMMKQIAGGIYQNMGLVEGAADALASVLVPNVETGAITGRGNSTTMTYGDMNINIYGAEGQDVRELARIVEQEITFNMNRRSAAYA